MYTLCALFIAVLIPALSTKTPVLCCIAADNTGLYRARQQILEGVPVSDYLNALERLCWRLNRAETARRLGVSDRTIRRWLNGDSQPYAYLQRLIVLECAFAFGELSALRGGGLDWSGWRIGADGVLYSPEGWAFTRGDLAEFQFRRLNRYS